MKHLTAILILILALTSLQGCVKKSEYEALQAKHNDTIKMLGERTQRVSDLEAEVASLQKRQGELEAAKTELESKLANALKNNSNLQGSVEEMQRALAELEQRKAEADARINEYKAFLAQFQKLADEGKLKIKVRDGLLVLELATDVLFSSGRAKLSDDGETAITEVAVVLAGLKDKKFQVEGHTDNIPTNNARFKSNWELASARAITVVQTMIEGGMPPQRISAASYGDTTPAASNDTDTGKATNRRIEIVVVPDLSKLPGFDELQKIGK